MAVSLFRTMVLSIVLLLSACGFQLQGRHDYPFKRLFIAGTASPALTARLKRMIEAGSDTKVVRTPAEADATLTLTTGRAQTVLSLTLQGIVNEFEIDENVSYTLTSTNGSVLIPSSLIRTNRSMTYSDQYALAKQQEADLLYADMDIDVVAQLMRRLALVQSMTPTPEQAVPAIQPRVPLPPSAF